MRHLVAEPTHIKGNIIDWIICKPDTIISEVHVADLISDHFAVHCSINTTNPTIAKAQLTYRKLKNILQDKFDSDILKSELLRDPASPLDGLVDQYNHVLLDLIDKHAPKQTKVVSQRSRNIPWIRIGYQTTI